MSGNLASSPRRSVHKKHPQFSKRASFTRGFFRPSFRPGVELLEDRLTPAAPTVIDPIASSITPLTAILGGNMTSDGGNAIVTRGVVYALTSVNPNPMIGGAGVTQVNLPPEVSNPIFKVTSALLAPNSQYSFKAFAINNNNPNETGYTTVATFSTSSGILMPDPTVHPTSGTDYAEMNKVLFFQPTPGQKLPDSNVDIPQIPLKQITFTNNLDQVVFPFMRDAAATVDPRALAVNGIYQGEYDPLDQLNLEYRGYLGYQSNGINYLGLLPGMTITISVPLVFWDGARCEIAVDGTYLVNTEKVNAPPTVPNPFQYYATNPDDSATARVILPALSSNGGPAGTTGMVMWYRQGLRNQNDRTQKPAEQAKAPAGDAPSQLIEWTIRDPVLSIINPNIDLLHKDFGETHANINYDVSYVDNMALPVAMAALDVPVPVQTDPSLDPRNPNPGPRLPYGWIGAAQSIDEFQKAIRDFISNDKTINGLGDYFGGKGWPQYYFPADRFPAGTPLKVPSGQSALSDSPLVRHTTSYDAPLTNHFMLTSGGATPISLVGAGGAYSDGTTTLRIVANTPALRQILQQQLQAEMAITIDSAQPGAPTVPAGTKVSSIGPTGNPGFNFTQYEFAPNAFDTVLEVQLNNPIPRGTNPSYTFQFNRVTSDYAATALINLWYTWAKYYVDRVVATDQAGLAGSSMTTDNGKKTNVIVLDNPATGLVPGMLVTGAPSTGIFPLRGDNTGATTIERIDPDNKTIHLSQAVGVSDAGSTYSFTRPSMNSPAIAGFNQATVLGGFTPANNEAPGVPDVLKFAQYVYQMLALMSQIPSEDLNAPISAQVLHNVIGGNITKAPLNGDVNHKTEEAFRDKVKSLLRGVNDFTEQTDQLNQWYPDPSVHTGGQVFNVYNLDPFVWFVHKKMGLSGYGFSLDDDAADISGNFSTKLGVAIGGLNGLPNHFEWSNGAPFGPVTDAATVLSGREIRGLSPYDFFAVRPYNANEKIPGANLNGVGVPAATYLYDFGSDGLYKYGYYLSNQPPPSQKPLPPPPLPGPLQIPPLVVNNASVFSILGLGSANRLPLMLPAGETTSASPYMSTQQDVTVPVGSTLKITSLIGNLTSYTQQIEQNDRVSIVPTPQLNNAGTGPAVFVENDPMPVLNTVVNGILDAGRVEIVNGTLSGTGTIRGSLNVFGPVSGYVDPIELKPVGGERVDKSWDNKNNSIRATTGASLVAGKQGGPPGKFTVTGDVAMFGASFAASARGAATQGTDYSWLSADGKVHLGNSNLVLSLLGYTPRAGDSLTIITAVKGITGRFSQGNSIAVNGFRFNITYNANSVVLTFVTSEPIPPSPAPVVQDPNTLFVQALYRGVLDRPPSPLELNRWSRFLRDGGSREAVAVALVTSPQYSRLRPNAVSFIRSLYRNLLGLKPRPRGVAAWLEFARNHSENRVALAKAFLSGPEQQSRFLDLFDQDGLS